MNFRLTWYQRDGVKGNEIVKKAASGVAASVTRGIRCAHPAACRYWAIDRANNSPCSVQSFNATPR
jgi:hypothetical protein